MRRVIDNLCFGVGALVALWAHFAMAASFFGINIFDDALRLLQSVYAGRGLSPYRDYGFVYPPGLAWFYGKLLGLSELHFVIVATAIVNFMLVVLLTMLLMRLARERRLLIGGLSLFILGGILPINEQMAAVEPNGILFLPIALALGLIIMREGVSNARFAGLVVVAFIGALVRWDRILFPAILETGLAFGFWFFAQSLFCKQAAQVKIQATCLGAVGLAMGGGAVLGIGAMLFWAMLDGALDKTILFVFHIPFLILPFRKLSLPMPIGHNFLWCGDVLALGALAVWGYIASKGENKWENLGQAGLSIMAGCALLPYTLTRADFPHFIPLAAVMVAALLAGITAHKARWILAGALVILVWPVAGDAASWIARYPIPPADFQNVSSYAKTKSCRDLFPAQARSLFVGQGRYEKFNSNFPIFYLMRPDLYPATAFLSDEPGLQNSCLYGAQIADDLQRAPRPLVLVLDMHADAWKPEDNLSATMESCGQIEAAIAAVAPVSRGTCQMDGHIFQVLTAK